MSQIVTSDQMQASLEAVVDLLKENIPALLIILGFALGFALVRSLFVNSYYWGGSMKATVSNYRFSRSGRDRH